MKKYPEKKVILGRSYFRKFEIRDWLMKNNYPELGLFCHALYFDKSASNWLMKNAPHLLATIKGVEVKDAIRWLEINGFKLLAK